MHREVTPIHYCDFSQVDHLKVCPIFTYLLSKRDGALQADDINALHEEVQSLLSENHRRVKLLEEETQILTDWQERKDKRKLPKTLKSSGRSQSESSSLQSSKKQKLTGQSETTGEDDLSAYPRSRTETLHRFWASVEPYCRNIMQDDIEELEAAFNSIEDSGRNYYSVPPLGKHYSERWAEEDLYEEQRDNCRITDRKSKSSVLVDRSSTEKLLKQSNIENTSADDADACPFGLLTQRLLAALIDENPSDTVEDNPDGAHTVSSPTKTGGKMSHRPVPISHAKSLETRLREELTQAGIFDYDEEKDTKDDKDAEDKVLAELTKKQEELHSVVLYNRQQKDRLIHAAKEEMKQQAIRNQILQLDADIIDTRQRLLNLKSKKKALSKKEKDAAWRAIRERNRLLAQLQ
ncbi:transcriptional adapter 3-B-like [Corticium candelabrum]|uniref:transcriptional adapter 3-B-like n=1 Tax=Corticium candelabrum TaxID=121492 RepID=UPI002E254E10|nr:transcriptional adapter 3-B-like [Corticium candelabrum]